MTAKTADSFQQAQLPLFKAIDPAAVPGLISQQLDKNRQQLAKILANKGSFTWDNLMRQMENLGDELNKLWSPVGHLHAVMETDALRKAYNDALPLLTDYSTELSQNEDLYQAIQQLANSPEFKTLTPAQQKIIQNDLRDFKLSGVHLSAEQKARLATLEKELSELTTKFSENIMDATNAWTLHITDKSQLEGLPEQALQLAIDNAKRRQKEDYLLTLEYPSYSTGIRFLKNRELRKTLYQAYTTRASDHGPNGGIWDNTDIMESLLRVRHEIANIVGFKNYAEYSLATKMAKKPTDVLHFLEDLLTRSKPIALAEFNELHAFAKQMDGIDDLQAWDIPYYSEKMSEAKFHFNEEDLRPYFPVDTVLKGMFGIMHTLFGLTIKEDKHIETWHPHARFFDIHDNTGALRGGFYIDLFARPHKRDGAWMDDCRVRRIENGVLQYPVAYLTCNFMPPTGDKPALLNHDDVITLFHEFGHSLHHMLTKVDYADVSGINGVLWDAVEFPSQFMENFCWERESLDLIAKHYKTGAPLPDDLYKKMLAAKYFQTGMQMVRQLEFSIFDFELHLQYDPNKTHQVQSTLDAVRKRVIVTPIPEFNRFQHSFSHIFAGGYAAGYYSYKWAEVLSADAYAKFEENGIFDSKTGQEFMQQVLEVGGVPDPMTAFVAFRGREPSIDALLRLSGMI
jgi:oligopeptidase A